LFYAHCGLDVSPQHGPMFRREQPHNAVLSGAATETTTECGASPRPPRTRG
jgi:hypothetical protein